MRYFNILCFFMILSFNASAQINGNGFLKNITQPIVDINEIDIQFNASIILDYNLEETLSITADENILEFIGIHFENGKLTLDQIKWIEPSRLPIITIGTPKLNAIYQGTHSKTIVKNVKAAKLSLEGNVGQIIVEGKANELSVITTGTDIDLSSLEIEKAFISIDDDSQVILDRVKNLETDLEEDARLILLSKVDDYPNRAQDEKRDYITPISNLEWIDFSIKNNSWKRNHFVVEGPKKDGSRFSYGFSLLPGISKNEKWSVGTKVYKEKKSGARELLVTIKSSDEGEVVKLFE